MSLSISIGMLAIFVVGIVTGVAVVACSFNHLIYGTGGALATAVFKIAAGVNPFSDDNEVRVTKSPQQ